MVQGGLCTNKIGCVHGPGKTAPTRLDVCMVQGGLCTKIGCVHGPDPGLTCIALKMVELHLFVSLHVPEAQARYEQLMTCYLSTTLLNLNKKSMVQAVLPSR